MGRIVLIRHTKVNVPVGTIYGRTDVLPDESFSNEVKEIRKKLGVIPQSFLFSSPLTRCRLLIEELFPKRNITFDSRLSELNFGKWEKQNWDDIEKTKEGKHWFNNYRTAQCPEGESFPELYKRVLSFFSDNRNTLSQGAVIVTHGGPFRILSSLIQGLTADEMWDKIPTPPYACVKSFELIK